jgi:hypothetical protein
MIDESVGWDPVVQEPSMAFRLDLLFLVIAAAVTVVRLIRVWLAVPPFWCSKRASDPDYIKLIRKSSLSLLHSIGCTFLVWAILCATTLYVVCRGLLDEKATGWAVIQFMIRGISLELGMALWVVSSIFLVRWHASNRIERLRD